MEDEEPLVHRAPVARLPAELVTNVINAVAHDTVHGHSDGYLPDESIAISHVCRFWRDAALGSGSKVLWTRAPLRHSAVCVRAFMERSHPLPVFLSIKFGDDSIPTSMTALAEAATYMDRVEGISFRSVHDNDEAVSATDQQLLLSVYRILSLNPAPSLKYLTWWREHGWEIDVQPHLPWALFAGHIPDNLRFVNIIGMGIPSGHVVMRAALTSLELMNCEAWDNVDELLDMLSCMPGLKRFLFDAASTSWGDGRPSQTYTKRSISLPCLRTLSFSDQPSRASINLLAYLRIPVDTRIHMEIILDENTPHDDAVQFCDALASHYDENELPDGQRFTFSAMSVGHCGGNWEGVTLHALYRNAPCLSLFVTELAPLNAVYRAIILETIHSFLRLPVMAHATRFNMAHSYFFAKDNKPDWDALQTCFPDLNTICLSRTAFHGLSPALLAPGGPGGVIFPSLTSLLFEGMTFDEAHPSFAVYFNALHSIAHHRASQGYPLKHIEFRTCCGAATLAQRLTIALPDVQVTHRWDCQYSSLTVTEATQWDHGNRDIHAEES